MEVNLDLDFHTYIHIKLRLAIGITYWWIWREIDWIWKKTQEFIKDLILSININLMISIGFKNFQNWLYQFPQTERYIHVCDENFPEIKNLYGQNYLINEI